jgi:hypothetical protein
VAFEQLTPPGDIAVYFAPVQAPVDRDRSFLINEEDARKQLPPRDVWLFDPYAAANKLETPVDERGLIDPHTLIRAIKSTVEPSYSWPTDQLSVHHLYFHRDWYGYPSAGPYARSFRELSVHKVLVPKIFENWVHLITNPADIPSQEVMQSRIESWSISRHLFKSVRSVVNWERRGVARERSIAEGVIELPAEFNGEDEIGKAYLEDVINHHFKGLQIHMNRLEQVPPEFRFIEPNHDVTREQIKRQEFARQLGKMVGPKALPMVAAVAA